VWANIWLDGLEVGQRYAGKVALLRTLAGELTAGITVLEAAIAGLLEHRDGCHAIWARPGIGPVSAVVLVAGIGGIARFPHPARLCWWAGLAPGTGSPMSRSAAGTSPGKDPHWCGGR
jgi:transposase